MEALLLVLCGAGALLVSWAAVRAYRALTW